MVSALSSSAQLNAYATAKRRSGMQHCAALLHSCVALVLVFDEPPSAQLHPPSSDMEDESAASVAAAEGPQQHESASVSNDVAADTSKIMQIVAQSRECVSGFASHGPRDIDSLKHFALLKMIDALLLPVLLPSPPSDALMAETKEKFAAIDAELKEQLKQHTSAGASSKMAAAALVPELVDLSAHSATLTAEERVLTLAHVKLEANEQHDTAVAEALADKHRAEERVVQVKQEKFESQVERVAEVGKLKRKAKRTEATNKRQRAVEKQKLQEVKAACQCWRAQGSHTRSVHCSILACSLLDYNVRVLVLLVCQCKP